MYKQLGVTTHESDEVVIYTKCIGNLTRNICNIHLIKLNCNFMMPETKNLIMALDILEKGYNNIIDVDVMFAIDSLQKLLMKYTELVSSLYFNHKE